MATFIDISILKNFTSIFTFLFIFVLVYASLGMFKTFGEGKKSLHAIIAMVIAFMVALSPNVLAVFQTFAPWFMMIIVLIFFVLFAVKMFGVSDDSITKTFHNRSSILTWIIIFTVIILLFSLGAGFGQESLNQGQTGGKTTSVQTGNSTAPTDTGDFNQNLYNTLFHPKILGIALVMLIVVIAMLLLTGDEKD